MRRLVTFILVMVAMTVLAAPVAARGNDGGPMNKKQCEDVGGVWVNERGTKHCLKLEATEWRPDSAEEPSGFWDIVDREISEDADTIWFYSGESQRGNVGARGTSDTHAFIDPGDVCAALGPQELWPPQVCAILYEMLFPD